MSKVWSYIALFALGFAAGLVITVKYIVKSGDQIQLKIRKLKNKGVISDSELNILMGKSNKQLLKDIERLQKELLERRNKVKENI